MEINKIYVQDCFDTMRSMKADKQKVDIILTSPPYCTSYDDARKNTPDKFKNHEAFYDVFEGFESPEAYREWTVDLFKAYDTVLAKDGVILYNLSYSTENPYLIYLCIADIINQTDFVVADCISWKKNSALPQNRNSNRLTRVCEFVFVFVRQSELKTFKTTKKVNGGTKTNPFYGNLSVNFIEAPNNDILDTNINKLNNATFSTDFVMSLLKMYAEVGYTVYDSFMGTGTTAVACKSYGCNYIGSELSEAQVEFSNKRLEGIHKLKNPKIKSLF